MPAGCPIIFPINKNLSISRLQELVSGGTRACHTRLLSVPPIRRKGTGAGASALSGQQVVEGDILTRGAAHGGAPTILPATPPSTPPATPLYGNATQRHHDLCCGVRPAHGDHLPQTRAQRGQRRARHGTVSGGGSGRCGRRRKGGPALLKAGFWVLQLLPLVVNRGR